MNVYRVNVVGLDYDEEFGEVGSELTFYAYASSNDDAVSKIGSGTRVSSMKHVLTITATFMD